MIISNNTLKDIIRIKYLKNKQAQRILAKLIKSLEKISTRLLLFQDLIYVPKY